MKKIKTTLRSGLVVPALLFATPGLAQDTLIGGALVTLDVGLGYTYEDDDATGTESLFGTRLGLGLVSETRSQRLTFSVGTVAEIGEGEATLANSDGQLGYAIFNRYTEASIDLSYREADIDEEIDPNTLTLTSGTRETHAAALQLITGRTTRFGTQTVLSYEQLDYVDVTDPDLVTQISLAANTNLRFTVSRTLELQAFGSWREVTTDDTPQEIETSTRFGVGATALLDRAWTGSATLAWSEIETDDGGAISTEDGLDFNLALTRSLANGTLSFSYDQAITTGDTISRFTVTRDMALANGAALTGSVGLVSFEGDVLPALGLSYDHEFLRGRTLSASLSQEGSINDDDESSFLTQLAVAYRQELTPSSFFATNLTAASSNVVSGASDDSDRFSIGFEYGHALTRDWDLVARADHTRIYEAGIETDQTSTVSLNLERSFSFRP